jgi:ribonuclease-3
LLKFFRKKVKDEFTKDLESFLNFEVKDIALYKVALTHPSKKISANYQRLEFLGDAVLNFVIASYLYNTYPDLSEGDLTKLRSKLVNKFILKEIALKFNLQKFINHQLNKAELDKSSVYADIIESIIGSIYLDRGITYAEQFIKEKILQQLDEVTQLEDTDYKSKIIQLAQKYKWKIQFEVEKTENTKEGKVFWVALYINEEKIAVGKQYNKKQAEQLASQEALEKLNIV